MASFIRDPWNGQDCPSSEVGGKAAHLARLKSLGFEPPRFVAIVASAMEADPAIVLSQLRIALAAAGFQDKLLAVRSSGIAEDGATASFAGQFESVLNVDAAGLAAALKQVWDSAKGERALAYGAKDGHLSFALGVVVQEMVDAKVSGVAFTADPMDGREDTVVISAVEGLGEGLVSGEKDADTYRVRGQAAVLQLKPGGATACLAQDRAIELAAHFKKIEKGFGFPLDIEWSLDAQGILRVLQARAITTLPKGELRIWDNSNIVESYSGPTLPLTFSYARRVYTEAYKSFARLLGFPESQIQAHDEIFSHRLGLIRGQVYYNLIPWYKSLTFLPGYALNKAFMERMMGVREELPVLLEAPKAGSKVQEWKRALAAAWGLLREFRRNESEIKLFTARMNRVLRPLEEAPIRDWEADKLAASFKGMERELLLHWKAPLANDFFAMVYFGVLSGLIEKWRPDLAKSMVNDLLVGDGHIISTQPARELVELARLVQQDPALKALFEKQKDDAKLWDELGAYASYRTRLEGYLKRWGARCAMELKLETVPLDDDPPALLAILRGYLSQALPEPRQQQARERAKREAAEKLVFQGLPWLRKPVLKHVLKHARRLVANRENLRFERTRSVAVVRRIFQGLGRRLQEGGLVLAERDVFYLHLDEVLGALDGSAITQQFSASVAQRKAEYEGFASQESPPERFSTRGPLALAKIPSAKASIAPEGGLKGMGCCPGIVRAPVRLVRDPRQAGNLEGHILVAERTDPGWTLLFPSCLGLLVERGSLLSHSAIVARELGLPCVVAVPGLLSLLKDGEVVEMDGSSGSISRVEAV